MQNTGGGFLAAFARKLYPGANGNGALPANHTAANCFSKSPFLENSQRCYADVGIYTPNLLNDIEPEVPEAPTVLITNLKLVHLIWHTSVEQLRAKLLEKLLDLEEGMRSIWPSADFNLTRSNNNPLRRLFLLAPLFQSEREPHDNFRTAVRANVEVRALLEPMGWGMLEWGRMSLARGRDGTFAPQFGYPDGMHHVSVLIFLACLLCLD
jgi:hypothetical protein